MPSGLSSGKISSAKRLVDDLPGSSQAECSPLLIFLDEALALDRTMSLDALHRLVLILCWTHIRVTWWRPTPVITEITRALQLFLDSLSHFAAMIFDEL